MLNRDYGFGKKRANAFYKACGELLEQLMSSLYFSVMGETARAAVNAREQAGCTALANGIAIPHGKTDSVDCLVAALGIKREGIDFGALDGQPSTIFVMTVSPDSRTGPHIQFLAEVSRPLNDASIRAKILSAASREEVLRLLLG